MSFFIDCIVPILMVASITATTEGPDLWMENPMLRQEKDVLLYAERPFSGRLFERSESGELAAVTLWHRGAMHGASLSLYTDGSLREVRGYIEGRKEGRHLGWWENGERRFRYRFDRDMHVGSAREWFENGSLAREASYVDGREEGTQVLYDEDGTIRANYVVRAGRRYGSLGAKPCLGEEGS